MNRRALITTALMAVFATAANADAIDPCSLLSSADMAELGLSKESVPSHEAQPGGVQACKYDGRVQIILSQAVPDRVLQLRAMQAKAREEGTPAQRQARGEYFDNNVMCKVVVASRRETSQCLGSSEQSVVGLAASRPDLANEVTYPASQLRIIATLVSRVTSRGG